MAKFIRFSASIWRSGITYSSAYLESTETR